MSINLWPPGHSYFLSEDSQRETITAWLLGEAEARGVVSCFVPQHTLQDGLRADWPNPSLQVIELREPINPEDAGLVLKGSPFVILCKTDHFDNMAAASSIAVTIACKHVRCRLLFCRSSDFDSCYRALSKAMDKRNLQGADPFLMMELHYWGAAVLLRVARVDLLRGYVA